MVLKKTTGVMATKMAFKMAREDGVDVPAEECQEVIEIFDAFLKNSKLTIFKFLFF
jgi:hypothetical protein